jgi:hypothetical protein
MRRRRRIAVSVLTVALVACAGCYVALHQAWRYEGGPIIDNGVISYPRFAASFHPVPFNREGTYAFVFRRFPAERAVIMLHTPTAPRRQQLESLTTTISMSVKDQDSVFRCRAVGSPAGGGVGQAFIASGPIYATGIWLMPCNGVSLAGCQPCTLSVTLGAIDPATPAVPLVPSLEGGGVELP